MSLKTSGAVQVNFLMAVMVGWDRDDIVLLFRFVCFCSRQSAERNLGRVFSIFNGRTGIDVSDDCEGVAEEGGQQGKVPSTWNHQPARHSAGEERCFLL